MKLKKMSNYGLRRLCEKLIAGVAIVGIFGTSITATNFNTTQTVQARSTKRLKLGRDGDCILKFDPSTKTLHIKDGTSGNTLGGLSIYQFIYNAKKHLSKKHLLKPTDIKHISIDGNITLPNGNYGDCELLFAKLYNLQTIDGLDKADAKDVTSMKQMFYGDKRLKTLDLSNWDTENTKWYMNKMFYGDKALKNLNLTGNFVVWSAGGNEMFRDVNPDAIQGIKAEFISNNS